MDIREIRAMTDDELLDTIEDQREALFNLRFQWEIGQLEDYGRIRILKKHIARLNTIKRERELAERFEVSRPRLRDALRQLAKTAEKNTRAFRAITEGYWNARNAIKRYYSFTRTPNTDGDTFYGTAADVDLDGLRSSANALEELKSLYVFHVNMYELTQDALDSIDAVFATAPDLVQK